MAGNSKGVGIALLLFCSAGTVAVTEAALRFLWPVSTGFFIQPPDTETSFYPDPYTMPGVSGASVVRTVNWGIRAGPLTDDPSEFRVLAIGGSTTANLYLDTPETWPVLVQERLRAARPDRSPWVGNAGRSGLSARDHVVHMKYLAPQVPGLDVVVILAGINDMTLALSTNPYRRPAPVTEPAAEEEAVSRAFWRRPGGLHEMNTLTLQRAPLHKRTAIYELLRRAAAMWRYRRSNLAQDKFGEVYATWRQHRQDALHFVDVLPPLKSALDEYRFNLERVAELARVQDVRPVFVTQPGLYRPDLTPAEDSLLWLGGIGNFQEESGLPYYSVAALRQALDQFNGVMLGLCHDLDVACVDLSAQIPRTDSMFFDDVHFTEAGARRVGEVLVEYLLSEIGPPRRAGTHSP